MTCSRCGAPLPRPDIRFCTRCGAPVGEAPPGPRPGGQPQPPYGQPPYGEQPYGQQQYGQPYGPPPDRRSPGPPLGPIVAGAVVVLLILGGVAYWAMSQMDDPPLPIGRSGTPTPVPTNTPVPTATRAPGIGITVPGPQGTPTTISLPIPGTGGTPGLPTITLPSITIPGTSGTQPPNAKLNADQARQKVKDTLTNCRVLQRKIDLAQVTFDAPAWNVRLPITGATWKVDDETGAVTPDERAAERARTCRV